MKNFGLILIPVLLISACGRKSKKIYNLSDLTSTPICQNGVSNDPDIICNPLGGGGSGGPTSGQSSGSNTGTTAGSSDGGTNSGTTGGVDGGSTNVETKFYNGLMAYLYEGDKTFKQLNDYRLRGRIHEKYVFLTNFDMPERKWDKGFVFGENEYLKNKEGELLVEWFSFSARGHIQLPNYLEDGVYEFMAISDDGIRVRISDETILELGTEQSPKGVCATKAVTLSKNLRKPFELDYFQGPRNKVALSLYLKRIAPGASRPVSKYCRKTATDAQAKAEGWTVVPASYFILPEEM